MRFLDALMQLIFGDGKLAEARGVYPIAVFSLGCGLMGLLVVSLDRIVYSVRGRSFLDLKYGNVPTDTVRLLCLWGLGAAFGGYLGSAFDAVNLTRAGCIAVGVGWPTILPRLIVAAKKDEPEQPSIEPEGMEDN